MLLRRVLGLCESIEINQSPDQKFRQGFTGAPAAARSRFSSFSFADGGGVSWFLIQGEGSDVARGWDGGWLRCFAWLFGYVKRACAVVPCFCFWLLRSGNVGVLLVFLYLVVHTLPPQHLHAIIFSPLQFLCILLLGETFVQVQVLQQSVSGPRFQPVSRGPGQSRPQ